jgi:endonuclease YncB( thermonuclease family)
MGQCQCFGYTHTPPTPPPQTTPTSDVRFDDATSIFGESARIVQLWNKYKRTTRDLTDEYNAVYDGDTFACVVQTRFGVDMHVMVRVRHIDAPEIKTRTKLKRNSPTKR